MDIRSSDGAGVKIAVPRLSRIANFDDLDPLSQEPDVSVHIIEAGQPLPGDADLVLIPGSKSTIADLAYFRCQGWDIDLAAHVRRGGQVLGICGGFQMLGARIADPDGVEGPPQSVEGLIAPTSPATKSISGGPRAPIARVHGLRSTASTTAQCQPIKPCRDVMSTGCSPLTHTGRNFWRNWAAAQGSQIMGRPLNKRWTILPRIWKSTRTWTSCCIAQRRANASSRARGFPRRGGSHGAPACAHFG